MIKNENGKVVIKATDASHLMYEFLVLADGVREAAIESGMPEKEVKSEMELAFKLAMMSPEETDKLSDKVMNGIDELIKELDEMFGGKK